MLCHCHTALIFFPQLFSRFLYSCFTSIFYGHFPFSSPWLPLCYSFSNAFSVLISVFLFSSIFMSFLYSFALQLSHLNFNCDVKNRKIPPPLDTQCTIYSRTRFRESILLCLYKVSRIMFTFPMAKLSADCYGRKMITWLRYRIIIYLLVNIKTAST